MSESIPIVPSSQSSDFDLTIVVDALQSVAKRAGAKIYDATSSSENVASTSTKLNSADLVTETDKAVEDLISSTLRKQFPTYSFIGEETYKPGAPLGSEPTFICDPIDGTTNFVHGYPYVSVSLGLAINRKPVVGVVFNPFTGVMYSGVKGQGSCKEVWRRGVEDDSSEGWEIVAAKKKLPLQPGKELSGLDGALVAVEWGSDRSNGNWETKIKTWGNLGRSKEEGGAMVHSARCLGSAALNLCAVAEGSIDLYWEGGCWAWDVCAGWIILNEAGGIVVDGNSPRFGGGRWEIPVTHRKYLALRGMGKGESQKKIIEEFWGHIEGEMIYEH